MIDYACLSKSGVFTSPSTMSVENTVFAAQARKSGDAEKAPATKAAATIAHIFGLVMSQVS